MQVKHKRMKRPWVTKEKEGRNFCFNHWWGNKWGNNKDIQERLKKWCRGRQTMAEKWQKQLEKTTQCKSIHLLSLFLAICYFTSYVLILWSRSVSRTSLMMIPVILCNSYKQKNRDAWGEWSLSLSKTTKKLCMWFLTLLLYWYCSLSSPFSFHAL